METLRKCLVDKFYFLKGIISNKVSPDFNKKFTLITSFIDVLAGKYSN